jgi:hypothetical protein
MAELFSLTQLSAMAQNRSRGTKPPYPDASLRNSPLAIANVSRVEVVACERRARGAPPAGLRGRRVEATFSAKFFSIRAGKLS